MNYNYTVESNWFYSVFNFVYCSLQTSIVCCFLYTTEGKLLTWLMWLFIQIHTLICSVLCNASHHGSRAFMLLVPSEGSDLISRRSCVQNCKIQNIQRDGQKMEKDKNIIKESPSVSVLRVCQFTSLVVFL